MADPLVVARCNQTDLGLLFLSAFTPRDQKAVKTAALTLRANPAFNVATAISELGVGEALISFLDEKGRPNVLERAFIMPMASRRR